MTQDRFWTIAGVIVGLIGAVGTIVIYSLTVREQTKQLQATVISETGLLNADIGSARSRLKILYDGAEVSNVSILDLRFANSGGQPIKSADMEEPVAIRISNSQQLISADVIKTKPSDLVVKPAITGDAVILSKTLLNPGDEFTLEIMGVPDIGKELTVRQVSARIVGLQNIKFQRTLPSATGNKRVDWWGLALGLSSAVIASLLGALTFEIGRRRVWPFG